jgi:hypothetical protein
MGHFRTHPADTRPEYHYWLGWFSDIEEGLREEPARVDERASIREMLREPVVDLTRYRSARGRC